MRNVLVQKIGKALNLRPAQIATKLGISRQALHKWERGFIPPDRALEIEQLTAGAVSAEEILRYAHEWRLDRERDRSLRRGALLAQLKIGRT